MSRKMALGGMTAALAVVIMSLGTVIPLATFLCPMLCIGILGAVRKLCGSRMGWAWYGAVAILSALLAPDKEAAAVFVFLGYYPMLKPEMDAVKFGVILKVILFNAATTAMYWLLIHLMGMEELGAEFQEVGSVITLILGNVTFLLLDRLLSILDHRGGKT